MCGIFGFAKTSEKQNDNQLEILKRLLTELTDESSIRGTDSTGFSIINPKARYTYKTLMDSSELVDSKDWSIILDKVDRKTTIAMGHVRLATTGDVKLENAHPFNIGDVTGVHNGIIHNYNYVASSMGKPSPDVDSQVLFQSLNRNEMSKAFEDINGDFAITWVKDSNKKVHLARESGRPMVVSYWKKARVLFWASTRDIMEEAMIRAGLRLPITNVPEDYIFTYDTDSFDGRTNHDTVGFETISQDDYLYTSYYNWGGTKYYTSPATKYLNSNAGRTKKCDYCYEYVPQAEVWMDGYNRNVCFDCEYIEGVSTCDKK